GEDRRARVAQPAGVHAFGEVEGDLRDVDVERPGVVAGVEVEALLERRQRPDLLDRDRRDPRHLLQLRGGEREESVRALAGATVRAHSGGGPAGDLPGRGGQGGGGGVL